MLYFCIGTFYLVLTYKSPYFCEPFYDKKILTCIMYTGKTSELRLTHGTLAYRLYRDNHPLKSITHYAAPGRVPYQQAIKGKFTKTETGQSFGPT